MQAADTPPVLPQDVKVYSPDRHFFAVSQLKRDRTSVFRVGSKTPLWEIPGYTGVLYLSNDGKHLAKGYSGGNILAFDARETDPFLTFYAGPVVTAAITVGQVFPRWRDLPRSTSGRPWGDFWGFEKPARFTIRLQDGKKIAFDADTGRQVTP